MSTTHLPPLHNHPFNNRSQIELFCEATPKAAENFLAHCASGYYDGSLFHRNIRAFMIQTGDPSGTGKGGESIWGTTFEDEVRSTLKVCSFFSLILEKI
jgi:peptidyl-prolyl cis-trans isomerase-like 3